MPVATPAARPGYSRRQPAQSRARSTRPPPVCAAATPARPRPSAARSGPPRARASARRRRSRRRSPRRPGRRRPARSSRTTSGTTTGPPEHVRLELHQPAVGGRAAVGAQLRRAARRTRPPSRRPRRPSGRRSPRARPARGARGRVPRVRPDDRAARVRIPVRRSEAGQRRHEVDAVVGVERARPSPRSRSAASMIPRPSRSHCTAAPVTNTLASSA